jgi:hypothetical protein
MPFFRRVGVILTVFMAVWVWSAQTFVLGLILFFGYLFFVIRHTRAAVRGYDIFEGLCMNKNYNQITHSYTYHFSGNFRF